MEKDLKKNEIHSSEIYLRFSLRKLCLLTVVLPVSSLIICFVTANIFQKDDIHETHCRIINLNLCFLFTFVALKRDKKEKNRGPFYARMKILIAMQVYNIIPSISAITGISPQRYLWRICVALHIGPRLLVATIYKGYYRGLLDAKSPDKGRWLLGLCFSLSLTEIIALCGVTYVSNRENYPVHEKIFITFMFSSLTYMLVTLKIHNLVHPEKSQPEEYSYKLKKLFFAANILSTIGLFIFFIKHRFYCQDMAFSWFSTCEYLIAFFNMCFHMTVILDFPSEEIIVEKGLEFLHISKKETSEIKREKAD